MSKKLAPAQILSLICAIFLGIFIMAVALKLAAAILWILVVLIFGIFIGYYIYKSFGGKIRARDFESYGKNSAKKSTKNHKKSRKTSEIREAEIVAKKGAK